MRAIILAAGMGTRLRPLTDERPKGLVEVLGKPIVERQIEFLKEKGIHDIIVVTGYLRDHYDYLVEKYGVSLIHNDKYDVYNNIYTMYVVKDYLPGSYVVESDFFWTTNIIDPNPVGSKCFCNLRENFTNEWIIRFNEESHRITEFEIGDGQNEYILSGISYWTEEDGKFIVEKLEQEIESGNFKELYWDEMVKRHLGDMHVELVPLSSTDTYEIDSVEDLKFAESNIVEQKKRVSI
ncbi:sugar phosphate nucleotidyltransferase [Sporosarcina saromensis]|uniref:Sugar phosphate nucleotidyltransferase n=1 Tax=Sporosarcina saromensis TaxID=359365 RepID=A0ABU4GAJ0_9BACL|nr:sugar phosphate nucleotidyltransferase [Sporosarcina saromensis]MDW0114028.1 sugar phosphate nucleotidyltransferase [Sporosarcina saromensis]